MSALTDLFVQVGQKVGWDFLLFVLFTWEVFYPDKLHWAESTKLKTELRKPNTSVIAAIEAVYDNHTDLSREKLVEILNGDKPRAYEFEAEIESIREHPGGD